MADLKLKIGCYTNSGLFFLNHLSSQADNDEKEGSRIVGVAGDSQL